MLYSHPSTTLTENEKSDYRYVKGLNLVDTFKHFEECPKESPTTWLDSERLDHLAYNLSTNIIYSNSPYYPDDELRYHVDRVPKPINDQQLTEALRKKMVKVLLGDCRMELLRKHFNYGNMYDTECIDMCYTRHPYVFGGAVGCDFYQYDNSLTQDEIVCVLARYPSLRIGYIVNTDRWSGKGEHWTALVLSTECCSLICSFGQGIEGFKTADEIDILMSKVSDKRSINGRQIQIDDHNCGIYALLFNAILISDMNVNTVVDYIKTDATGVGTIYKFRQEILELT